MSHEEVNIALPTINEDVDDRDRENDVDEKHEEDDIESDSNSQDGNSICLGNPCNAFEVDEQD